MEGFFLTQSEIPTDEIKVYRNTQYCVAWDGDPFRADDRYTVGGVVDALCDTARTCGVFIAAFNPFGEGQNDEANEAAHGGLGNTSMP
jgi:hypothetical protein